MCTAEVIWCLHCCRMTVDSPQGAGVSLLITCVCGGTVQRWSQQRPATENNNTSTGCVAWQPAEAAGRLCMSAEKNKKQNSGSSLLILRVLPKCDGFFFFLFEKILGGAFAYSWLVIQTSDQVVLVRAASGSLSEILGEARIKPVTLQLQARVSQPLGPRCCLKAES